MNRWWEYYEDVDDYRLEPNIIIHFNMLLEADSTQRVIDLMVTKVMWQTGYKEKEDLLNVARSLTLEAILKGTFDGDGFDMKFCTYLKKALRGLYDHVRKMSPWIRYVRSRPKGHRYEGMIPLEEDMAVIDPFDAVDDHISLADAMRKLTPKQAEAVALYHLCDATDAEVGMMMGVSRQAATRLRTKGLKNLKKYLEGG